MNLLENTHPFTYDRFMFAHNGTIPSFDRVRDLLLAAMSEKHRTAIRGQTDSEHLFHLILSQYDARPDAGLLEALRSGIDTVLDCLARTSDTLAIPGINLLLMDGRTLVGSRLARSLWYTERDHVHACEVCGGLLHVLDEPGPDYRAVVVASEQITVSEQWRAVPDGSAFQLEDGRLEFVSL
jgi:glutamine amidotransferase